jgi:hypothetical protein
VQAAFLARSRSEQISDVLRERYRWIVSLGAARRWSAQKVKICSGRFSAGLGAAVSWRGLMIGGGGSTANRTAAEVIGTAELVCGATAELEGDDDDDDDDDAAGVDGALGVDAGVEIGAVAGAVCSGRCSIGLIGALCIIGRGAIGRGDGVDIIIPMPTPALGAGGASPPRKSLTRVSTS